MFERLLWLRTRLSLLVRRRRATAAATHRWAPTVRSRRGVWDALRPPQLLALSIVGLIAVGTAGLMTLPGLYTGARLSWLDALYTMTSAVCVTGLSVVDTATYFTRWGQAWLLVFIQLGALGIIAFTSVVVALLGQRMSLRQEILSASSMTDVAPHVDERRLIRDVVVFTFAFEAVGAVVLTGLFARTEALPDALWYGVFHSVSAFCNAGFATFSNSLMGFQTDAPLLLVVCVLVVVGSLGFLTIEELSLWLRARRRGQRFRLSLHSRLVLATTAGLLAVGTVGGYVIEGALTLATLGEADRWVNAFLFSAMRTAGFSTIDYTEASAAGNFFTILLMFIGGSPGSVAGGLKTTTFALLVLLAWSRFRGRDAVGIWGRSVPQETMDRAIGQAMTCMTITTLGIFGFTLFEGAGRPHDAEIHFLGYMFEAVSAFGTVGLSMNITPTLSDPSRVLSILLMFAGRVGPIALAAALARPSRHGIVRYAYEDVVVA